MSDAWYGRGGHLTVLSLERHAAGEIDASAHLADCAACGARLAAIEADTAAVTLRPPASLRAAAAEPTAPTPWAIYGGVLAAAAAVLFFVLRPTPVEPGLAPATDGIRLKGGFDVEVHARDGSTSKRLFDGDPVAPGVTLGFKAKAKDAGHLLILGRDGAGKAWLVYPQQGGGRSAPFGPVDAMRDLGEAVTLDATPGDERLVALHCAAPVEQRVVAPVLARDEIPAGCVRRALTLRKSSP